MSLTKGRRFYRVMGVLLCVVVSAGQMLPGRSAGAATYTWNNAGTTWSASSNWSTTTPGGSDVALFNLNSVYTNQPGLTSTASLGGIWDTGSGSLTISGSTLTLNGTTINNNANYGIEMDPGCGSLTISAPLVLGGSQTWYNGSSNLLTVSGSITNSYLLTLAGSGNATLAGVISGTGGLAMNGTGLLSLTASNTFTGPMTIGSGTVSVGSGYLGGGTYAAAIANSGTLIFGTASAQNLSGVISGSGGLNLNGTGIVTLSGASPNTITGVTTVTQGGLTLDKTAGIAAIAGTINMTGGVFATTTTNQTATTTSLVMSGTSQIGTAMTDTLAYLSVTGTAGKLNFGSGTNFTVLNTMTLTSTPLTYNASYSLAANSANSTLTVGSAGVGGLVMNGAGYALGQGGTADTASLVLSGSFVGLGTNYLIGESANATLNLNGAVRTFNVQSGTSTIGPIVTNGGILETGSGLLILTASNTFTSGTTISSGTLQLGSGVSGQDGSITSTSGVTNNSALYYNIAGSQTASYAISGTGSVTKLGVGAVTLAGSNSYSSGTTISGGLLTYATTTAIPSSGLITLNGGELAAMPFYSSLAPVTGWLNSGLLAPNGTGGLAITANDSENITLTATNSSLSLGSTGAYTYSGLLTPSGTTYYLGGGLGALTFAAPLSGGNSLVVAGPGSSVILSTSANSYTGGTSITSGTLTMGNSGSLGTGPIAISGGVLQTNGSSVSFPNLSFTSGGLQNGSATTAGTLTLGSNNATNTYAGVFANGGAATLGLLKSGTGALVLTGANTYTGGTTVSQGVLQDGDGTTDPTITGAYVVNSGALLRFQYNASGYTGTPTFSTVTGGGTLAIGSLKTFDTGMGAPALTAGFTGTIQVEGGRLVPASAASEGLGNASTIVIVPGGMLALYNVTNGTISQNLVISGSGYGEAGYESAIRMANAGSNNMLTGTVTLAANATLAASGTGTVAGVISGSNGANLNIGSSSQANTVDLSNANTFTGNTNILYGTLALSNSGALQNSTLNIGGTGLVFDRTSSGNYQFTLGGLSGATNISLATNADGGSSLGVALTVGGNNASTTYSGILSGGSFSTLTKNGSGSLTLTGADSYAGNTTISGGTLEAYYPTLSSGGTISVGGSSAFVVGVGVDDGIQWSATQIATLFSSSSAMFNTGAGFGIDTANGNFTYGSSLGNTGTFFKLGANSLTLTGSGAYSAVIVKGGSLILATNQSFTGPTNIFANSTLQIGSGGTAGSLSTSSPLIVSGGLAFDRSNTVTQGVDFSASPITGSGSFAQIGTGPLVLNTSNTYTGGTSIIGGSLIANFAATGAPVANILPAGGALTLGGALQLVGSSGAANSQALGNLSFLSGADVITFSPSGASSLSLSASSSWLRSVGATLNLTTLSSSATFLSSPTTLNNVIVGLGHQAAFATIAGADWATVSGGSITALSTYNTNTWGAGNNTDVTTATGMPSAWTTNTLRFNSNGALSLTLTGANTLQTGGILMTPSSSAAVTLTGGSLTSSTNEIVVQQYSSNLLTIASTLINSSNNATAFTMAGTGAVTLSNLEYYTGGTIVNGGMLNLSYNSGGSGALRNGLTINPGGTVNLTVANALGYSGSNWVQNININGGVLNTSVSGVDNGWDTTINMTAGTMSTSVAGGYFSMGEGFSNGANGAIFNIFPASSPSVISAGMHVRDNSPGGILFNVARGTGSSDLIISGPITAQATGGITLVGNGITVLSAANTYTGPTSVSGGTLALTGTGAIASTSAITLTPGAVLDVSGLSSTFTLGAAQTLTAGRSTTAGLDINGSIASSGVLNLGGGTLTVAGNASLNNGGSMLMSMGSSSQSLLALTGANPSLSLSGITTIVPTALTNGTFTLINGYTSETGSTSNLAITTTGYRGSPSAIFNVGATATTVTVTGATPGTLTWTGNGGNNNWDVATTSNWNNGTGADVFYHGDAVTFNDTASTTVVSIPSTVYPSSVAITTAGTYTIGGAGGISGPTGLTKSGAGVALLTGNNSYTGTTLVSAGTLQVGGGTAAATGSIGSGLLNIASGATFGTNLPNSFFTMANSLSGAGTFYNLGSGTVNYTGASTVFSGSISLNAGTFNVAPGASITGLGAVTQNPGTTVAWNVNGTLGATTAAIGVVGGGTGVMNINSGGNMTATTMNLAYLNGTFDVGDTATINVNSGGTLNATNVTMAYGNYGYQTVTATISINGVANVANFTGVAGGSAYYGTRSRYINVNPGGELNTTTINLSAAGGQSGKVPTFNRQLNLNGGTLANIPGTNVSVDSTTLTTLTSLSTLSVPSGNTMTINGTIGGTGGLILANNGSYIFAATNSYTGPTTIAAGTLQIGTGGTGETFASPSVINYSSLVFNHSDALTYAGVISGNGSLTNLGAGQLTLTNTNTFTGPTTFAGSTLQFGTGLTGQDGAITGSGAMTNNGSLVYDLIGSQTAAYAIGGTGSLTMLGTNSLTLAGVNTYSGPTTISAGTLAVNGSLSASSSVSVSSVGTLAGSGLVAGNVAVTGAGAINLSGGTLGSLTATGANWNGTGTVAGPVNSNSGIFAVASGANLIANSGFNLNAGTLTGLGSISGGTTTLAAGTLLAPGATPAAGSAGTLTLAGLTTAGSSTINFDLSGSTSGANDLVAVTGGLTLSGTTTIPLYLSSGSLSASPYTLFTYGSLNDVSGTSAFAIPTGALSARQTATINLGTGTNSAITLTVSGFNANLTWTGTQSGVWVNTVGSTSIYDWISPTSINPGGADFFTSQDAVTFNNTAGITSVTLSGTVQPSSITVTGTNAFVFTGSGSIGGSTGLTLTGPGSLTLANSGGNSYLGLTSVAGGTLNANAANVLGSGTVAVSGGTLNINYPQSPTSIALSSGLLNIANSAAFGSGSLNISGGSLDNTSGLPTTLAGNVPENWSGNFAFLGSSPLNMNTGAVTLSASSTVVVSAGTLTVGGGISGAGALTKNGPGTLVLGGNGNYSGGTTLANGVLTLNNSGALGTGALTISGGSIDSTVSGGSVALANNLQNWNADFAFNGTQNLNLGSGTVTLSSSRTVTVDANALTVAGPIVDGGNQYSLTKAGPGTLTLTGTSTYTGGTTISSGTLQLGSNQAGHDGSIVGGVTDNGMLVYDPAGSPLVGYAIVGTGSLSKIGAGTAILTATNTYAGSTLVSAGTLQFGNNNGTTGSIGAGLVTIASGAALVPDLSNNYVLSNSLSGGGTLFHLGSGTVSYTGTSSAFTGTISINNGGTFTVAPGASLTGVGTLTQTFPVVSRTSSSATWNVNGTLGATTVNLATGETGTYDTSNAVMNINSGGSVTATTINMAYSTGFVNSGVATVNVSSGGTLTANNVNMAYVNYGYQTGKATLNINGVANINNISGVNPGSPIYGGTTGNRYINVNPGGELNTTAINLSQGAGTNPARQLNLKGGTLSNIAGTNVTVDSTTVVTLTGTSTLSIPSPYSMTINGAIGGTGGFTTAGNGTYILTAANSYTGGTSVNGGTLQLRNPSALGSGGAVSALAVNSGVLDLNSYSITAFSFSGAAGIVTDSSTGAYSPTLLSVSQPGSTTFGGTIQDGANGTPLALNLSSGSLTLSGTNTFSGGLNVNYGSVLTQTNSAALPAASVATVYGTLDLGSQNASLNGLSGYGTVDNLSGTGSNTLKIGSAGASSEFDGVIQNTSGTLALYKTGTGTFTLTGSNTYAGGTTMNNGTLLLGNGATGYATGYGNVTLNGGTLATTYNNGSIGGNLIAGSGPHTIAPGAIGGFGTLTVGGSASLNSNSTLDFNINGASQNELIVNGGLSVTGTATIDLSLTSLSGPYVLATFANSPGLSVSEFNVAGLTVPGYALTVTPTEIELLQTAGNGSAVWANAVPGSWNDNSKWTPTIVPNGAGYTATFNAPTTSNVTVTLDSAQTIGMLTLANSGSSTAGYILTPGLSGTGSLTFDNTGGTNGDASIVVLSGSHSILSSITLAGTNTAVSLLGGGNLTLAGNIGDSTGGHSSLTVSSSDASNGTLTLSGTNSFGNGAWVQSGNLILQGASSLAPGSTLTIGVPLAPGGVFAPPSVAVASPAAASGGLAPVPEPGTFALLAVAALAGAAVWRRKSIARG